ncbi:MAG: L-serine ammonia-lyase, iron-sulfur-dependent subunit beta [Terrimicrobiaceae bacterium]
MSVFSAFEIIGPPMTGPSSSHTAGAVRIGLAARALLGTEPADAQIALHGSFAATGAGHATDRALVAGLLNWPPDDARLKDALTWAGQQNLHVVFQTVDLGEDVHPNSARLVISSAEEKTSCTVTASSIGGGSIEILTIDGFTARVDGCLVTLVMWHKDRPGFLSKITTLLACAAINIATIRTTRKGREGEALTLVETDEAIPDDCRSLLGRLPEISRLREIPRLVF